MTLVEAVRLAFAHHPSMGIADAREGVSVGMLRQAEAAKLPAIHSEASLARYQEPSLVAPLHGFDPTMAPEFDRNLVRGNLMVSYSIYDGGAREGRIDEARSGEASAVAGRAASRVDLMTQVSAAYLEVLNSTELLEAAESQRAALEAERDRVGQFLQEGKAAQVELLRVEAALSQAEAVEISVRTGLQTAWGRLGRLTGRSTEVLRAGGLTPIRLFERTHPMAGEVMDRARRSSPELEMARHRLAGASAGVRVAESNWRPSLRAAGSYSEFGSVGGDHTLEWQGSLQVSFPVFTGGARRAERDRAAAEERQASEVLRLTELQVEESVEEALAAVTESQARREALERGVEQALEVARIEALALEVGVGVQTDFLRAQAELFQTRATLAQARHGEVMANVRLARVTGELSLEWLEENMEVVR
jgi:outer membrane protein